MVSPMNSDNSNPLEKDAGKVWIYYKLLLGKYIWAFDFLVVEVAKLSEDPRVVDWFFIRYVDEDGPHMRLRFKVKSEDAKAFDREVYPLLHEMTSHLTGTPFQAQPRLVNLAPADAVAEFDGNFIIGAKREDYKPETDVYGGEAGVQIAEDMFRVSSEIAVDLIREDLGGAQCRKELCPALMLAAIENFAIEKSPANFLDYYVSYWGASTFVSGSYLETFHENCAQLLANQVQIVRADADYSALESACLQKLRGGLKVAHKRYREMAHVSDVLLERVVFYFIHLMNNRLGFTAIEEVYIALLVKTWINSPRDQRHVV